MTRQQLDRNTDVARARIRQIGYQQWIVPSRRVVGVTYVVTRHAGRSSCTCKAAGQGMRCWHVAEVEATLAPATPERPDPALGLHVLTGGRQGRKPA